MKKPHPDLKDRLSKITPCFSKAFPLEPIGPCPCDPEGKYPYGCLGHRDDCPYN